MRKKVSGKRHKPTLCKDWNERVTIDTKIYLNYLELSELNGSLTKILEKYQHTIIIINNGKRYINVLFLYNILRSDTMQGQKLTCERSY